MYILKRNSRLFGVNIKNRTCIIGFQKKEHASRLLSNLKMSRTELYLERQEIKTFFETDCLENAQVSEFPAEFNYIIELNNLMMLVANDVYVKNVGSLSLDGIIMDYDFQNDLKITRTYYLDDLYNLDEQIYKF